MEWYEKLKDNKYFEFFEVKKKKDRGHLTREELFQEVCKRKKGNGTIHVKV